MKYNHSHTAYTATIATKQTTWLQRTMAVAALVITAATAHAVVLPVTKDTASTTAGQLTSSGGKAIALAVTKTTKSTRAYLDFDVASTGLSAGDVSQARLKIYIAAATTPGALEVAKAAGDWSETTAGVAPAATGTPVTIPLAAVAKKKFILVDVTQIVKDWLTTPASDFGFIVEAPNATTKVQLGSKEGSATGYPAELEIDLTADIGPIAAADLDSAFAATLPLLGQANTFTGANSFTFGSGARTVTIGDDSSGKTPVINVGGTGVNAGDLRLRNALHVFPSDDGTRSSEILLHDSAGVSTIGMFGTNGYIGATSIEVTTLGVGGTNGRADFTFFNGGPAKLLTIKGGADQTPEFVVGSATGDMRVRNRLDILPSEDLSRTAELRLNNTNGLTTIAASGETGTVSTRFITHPPQEADLSADGTITPTGTYMKVRGIGDVSVVLSAITAIANGTAEGQMLILRGTNPIGAVTVPNGANTRLAASSRVLDFRDMLTLIWDGFDWVETAFSNN